MNSTQFVCLFAEESGSTESVFVMLNGEESEIVFSYFSNLKVSTNSNQSSDVMKCSLPN